MAGNHRAFLDKKLPVDWNDRNTAQRRDYFLYSDPLNADGVIVRNSISIPEILNECVELVSRDFRESRADAHIQLHEIRKRVGQDMQGQ